MLFRSVHLSDKLQALSHTEPPRVSVGMNGGLLDIGFDFTGIDQSEVDDVLDSLMSQKDYFISKTGQVLIFDENSKRISQTLQQLRSKHSKNGVIQTHSLAAYQLSELFKDQERVDLSEDFRQLAYDLTHPEELALPKLKVEAELRDYQETGVKWLSMLNKYGFGGILADRKSTRLNSSHW